MARILYGVMGNTYGHVARAWAVASRMPDHEFYFVGGHRVPEVLGPHYSVLDVPVKHSAHGHQRLNVAGSYAHLARCLAAFPRVRRQLLDLIERWQPDIAICDREFFLPHAARTAGLDCVSLDHAQVLNACRYPVPLKLRPLWAVDRIEDNLMYGYTQRRLVVSFYHPPLKRNDLNELLPPVLRSAVTNLVPSTGNHVLVYQSSAHFPELFAALSAQSRPVIVYGVRDEFATEGNLTFKPYDADSFLSDLAGCAYVVGTAGHNLLCEALYLGKPIFCFPISLVFEQFLNAWYVRELGYGDFSTTRRPTPDLFRQFEERLGEFGSPHIRPALNGTAQVVQRLREIISA